MDTYTAIILYHVTCVSPKKYNKGECLHKQSILILISSLSVLLSNETLFAIVLGKNIHNYLHGELFSAEIPEKLKLELVFDESFRGARSDVNYVGFKERRRIFWRNNLSHTWTVLLQCYGNIWSVLYTEKGSMVRNWFNDLLCCLF